ncbi:MAG: sugar ABC transporter substrate-binding protein [Lachnospiraceae bacterium]|jgi:alpha-1,4-digalacturonate transport system substrate-binding protein|nr:sugar ABC transporter substrate-binding protein [Lachnospiraceae bacterium]MCH4029885.1 sugar ABC transporter substrate-binding protein [Lachnospiraceae bacterium]MCH4109402.1 sugar ABC transporter substrate-binding protein [Lachnospiraceae bacterium]MCI1361783.1 sugar ABC transporter substrate-binding protein [Lachnospiraceae bacterium]MCI1381024.1 sugar ABC transporter substrate-binding protein [Lachnospiraceae bacterium]
MANMKRIAAGAFAAVMAAGLTACGSNSTVTTTTGASGSATPTTSKAITGKEMSVMVSEMPSDTDALGNALSTWASESGNTIKYIVVSNDDMLTKFPAMAKNKDLPDLISTTGLHQLYPDEFIKPETFIDLTQFNDAALRSVGKAYTSDEITGLPDQYTVTCLYYNQDAFDKAGLTAPTTDNPWTWDELFENAKTLQEKGGVKYGFAADVSRARYDIMMYANGGSITEKDGDTIKVAVNSPQNIETLEKFVQANNDVMPKAIWAGGTTDNPVEYFKNGDAGILLSGSWNYNTFSTDISSFKFGVMTSPKGSKSQAAIVGGGALAVPKNGKQPELAEQFLQWLYTEKNYSAFLQLDKGPSVMKNVSYDPGTDKATADYAVIQNEVNYVTDAFLADEAAGWRQYKDNEYRDALKQAVAGEVTAKDALDGFAKELTESSGWKDAY